MSKKLEERHLICAEVLLQGGRSVRSVAEELGVDESTLRHRLKRRGLEDGRRGKKEACESFGSAIAAWMDDQQLAAEEKDRPEAIISLYDDLVTMGYTGSYKALVRYVRRRQASPIIRPKRRVEVRPGSQGQIDWTAQALNIVDLGGPVVLQAFCMSLGFSRMWAVVWAPNQKMASWIHCHNGTLKRLGGVPWTLRHDLTKTAVVSGSGPWAVHNEGYNSYADQLGFLPDACQAYRGDHKGKVERRNRDIKWLQVRKDELFQSLESLQAATDERGLARAKHLTCPITGGSVYDAWLRERDHLTRLPETLPDPFDVQVSRCVTSDCLVNFEGRQYQVPAQFVQRDVQVRGCAQTVEIYSGAQLLRVYPRSTECRILLSQALYDADVPADARVAKPMPLGRIGREIVLENSWEWDAPQRSIDVYARLVKELS